ncbi:unnamed protein product, partial [Didymodactylos carnosus]
PKYKRHASIILPLFRRGKILNNYDLIIDCTDKLLDQWRSTTDNDPKHFHLNIVDQCQNLSLAIFGFIGFDYDFQTLKESNINKTNNLTQALNQVQKTEVAKPEQEKKGLYHEEVINELLLFIVARSETTGATASWFIYFMSKYRRVQALITAELRSNKYHAMGVEQIESLTYLDRIIQEILRFLRPVISTTRTLTVDDQLPGSGVQLHKDDEI